MRLEVLLVEKLVPGGLGVCSTCCLSLLRCHRIFCSCAYYFSSTTLKKVSIRNYGGVDDELTPVLRHPKIALSLPGYRKLSSLFRYLTARQIRVGQWYSPSVGVMVLVAGLIVFFSGKLHLFSEISSAQCALYSNDARTQGKLNVLFMSTRPHFVSSLQPFNWPSVAYGGSPPIATRTGWMAIAMLPFLMYVPVDQLSARWICLLLLFIFTRTFATKWNIITLLTGVSHEKIQVYHHWTAWIMCQSTSR